MKITLANTVRLNFAVTTNEVRVTFSSRHDGTLMQKNRLDKLVGHHNDICECPPTLKNLLVVRDLLDKAIEACCVEEGVK